MSQNKTKSMVYIAMIAALYAVLTLAIAPLAYGQFQFRISEALTVLPVFTPLAIPGLTLGCALANLIGALIGTNPTGYIDALIGSCATLLAAVCSYQVGKLPSRTARYLLVPAFPVLINALVIGAEITVLFAGTEAFVPAFIANAVSVGIGQLVICYALGVPLMMALERKELYKKIFAA